MAATFAKTLVFVALVAHTLAAKTLFYNIGGLPIGKFCADPSSYLIAPGSSGTFVQQSQVAKIGALASQRVVKGGGGKFEYLFPVGPGTYRVVLGWAEVFPPAFGNGKRLFDIWINDKLTFKSWDVYKGAGGPNKALWQVLQNVKVTGKNLKISLVKGAVQDPFISVIEITANNGKDLGSCGKTGGSGGGGTGGGTGGGGGVVTKVGGDDTGGNSCSTGKKVNTGMTGGEDHQAHSVAGGFYTKVDFEGDGKVTVALDGSRSHSHYFNPTTKASGKIVSYKWEANGKVIGTTQKVNGIFPIGKTIVKLTVKDQMGDVACDTAVVTGLDSAASGAYCYFYPGITQLSRILNTNPKPTEAVPVKAISFPNLASFPFKGKFQKTWTVRCITNVKVGTIPKGALGLRRWGRVAFYSGATTYLAEGAGGGAGLVPVPAGFKAGTIPLNIVYHKSGPAAKLELTLWGKTVGQGSLNYKQGATLPVVSGVSPATSQPSGGGLMQVFGSGFVNNPVVYVGKFQAKTQVTSTTQLLVTVPSSAQAGGKNVIVWVGNKGGQSNSKVFKYGFKIDGTAPVEPIKWKQTFLQKKGGGKAYLPLLTSVALGPDFNYYFGSQDGFVHKVSAGKNLIVQSQCKSGNVGQARSVLGIAFNPWKKDAQPYFTTSTLFRKSSKTNTPLKNKVDGWANGNVETLYAGCGCFCKSKTIITGLPVSHHDHSVNKIQFFLNGDMLISVAGSTNGGHNTPNNLLGGLEESPLSGAILLAKTSKGDNIAGNIKYNQYWNPNKAFKVGAPDVTVFATGLRNCFGITQTTTGRIYATDNGANTGFGLKSTSCNSQVKFPASTLDELNLIIKGGYYGHPNRNRGRANPVQCKWGAGYGPVTTFQSSTNGIIEYRSNAFRGNLKGDLIATQYTTVNAGLQGKTFRVQLSPNGQVKSKLVMSQFSGVAAENGLHGEIVMPRVGKNSVAVLQPSYFPLKGPFVVSITPRIGQGGQRVLVGGNNFKAGLKAFIGGKPCTAVAEVYGTSFKCTTPPGSGFVSVEVINPDGAKSPKYGGDWQYV